jgi:hypothetical protein
MVASKFDHNLPDPRAESKRLPPMHDSFMDFSLRGDFTPEIYAKFLICTENYPNSLRL